MHLRGHGRVPPFDTTRLGDGQDLGSRGSTAIGQFVVPVRRKMEGIFSDLNYAPVICPPCVAVILSLTETVTKVESQVAVGGPR